MMNRSITEVCNSTPASSSSPTRSANAASLPAANNSAFARAPVPDCACHHDPPRLHGPYITWTRKVNSKTVTRRLTPEQLERYQPWFENDRRLSQMLIELSHCTAAWVTNSR